MIKGKKEKRHQRHKRVRAKIKGKKDRPRLCVFRSNTYIYAQLIDDEKGKTLLVASDLEIKQKTKNKKQKTVKKKEEKESLAGKKATAFQVGQLIADKAIKKGIKKVVFDRGGYQYHGRVKALAEGARGGGLKF